MNSSTLKNVLKAFAFWGIFELGLLSLLAIPAGLPNWIIGLVFGLIISVFAYLLSWLFLKADDLTLSGLGLIWGKGSFTRFVAGLFSGMAVVAIFLLINVLFADITFEINPDFSFLRGVILSCLTFILLSSMEEIAFRGYFLKKLQGSLGTRAAIYITSICFGFYHGLNVESMMGPAIWGLVYGVLALWSRGLAIPIGFHAGLNFVPAMLGEKPRYSEAVWTISVQDESSLATLQTIGSALQAVVLITGVVLIEVYIHRQKKNVGASQDLR